MALPKLIDNMRVSLGQTLKDIAPQYKELSIATGYWDIPGTAELIDLLEKFSSIRLLIGQEPMSFRFQKKLHLDFDKPDAMFPSEDFAAEMVHFNNGQDADKLRETTARLASLINKGVLKVRVYKKSTLHAKAYIFGNYESNNSVAVVGSSNFTKAGMFTNTELNTIESNYQVVNFKPVNETQENGYLSWFDSLWNDPSCEEWTGDFCEILQNSPLGDLTYGPYDSYVKTLMEVYPEEMIPPQTLKESTADILFSFQNRNAGILINKLNNQGVAILADSVGLGKTITAGAVVKHYLEKDKETNILVIAPAALKAQWRNDLANVLNVDEMQGDYRIVSQQDSNAIDAIYEEYQKSWRRSKHIDLFVIDEAHNLRSNAGRRHDSILRLLQQHPNSHILLLTATPVNNSLMDIANIIQLASKGKIRSVNVSYPRPNGGGTELMDFFEALKRIQSGIKKAEKEGEDIEKYLETYKPTIHEGLRHYLVRSTRQGVEAEGGIVDKDTGKKKVFPKSDVSSLKYKYDDAITQRLFDEIGAHVTETFEGLDPRKLNLTLMADFTQQSCHPLEFLNEGLLNSESVNRRFSISESNEKLFLDEPVKNLVHNILQLIFVMGFVPYRPDVYQHAYYGKTIEEMRDIQNLPDSVKIQLAVHNIMQITWLKRMESSAAALLYSVENYEKRIAIFEKYLNKNYIVNLADATLLETDYNDGEDTEQAFADYDAYLAKKEEILEAGGDASTLKKQGVEKKVADPKVYNIKQIKADLMREKTIIKLMKDALYEVANPVYDPKLHILHDQIKEIFSSRKYGNKVLVFSFFADTIKYLEKVAPDYFTDIDPDFREHSGFVYGQSSKTEEIASKFSPKSKHYEFKEGEKEINFLFSTDVLSEGQNLQDAGYLVNYDLHWNPVRMIQRNGRINRLGSLYENVLISNMRPTDELDLYLNLVNRLERKIKTIRNTIGLDQGVLSSSDVNPIEFIEKYYNDGTLPDADDSILSDSDKHIIELRKFLGENPIGSREFKRISNMPLGKWNYLPDSSSFTHQALSMVKVEGQTVLSKKKFSEIFFIDVTNGDFGPVATYIDYTKALDYIQASPKDNERKVDKITVDRLKIWRRVKIEANRQFSNPQENYKITQQYERALQSVATYLVGTDVNLRDDLQGVIKKGVTTTDLKARLEKNLREINKENSENGSLFQSTVTEFIQIFKDVQDNVAEEREIIDTKGVLNYAKQ